MIAELRAERAGIEDALAALERLARSHGKRRGRPPNWMVVQRAASSVPGGEKKDSCSQPGSAEEDGGSSKETLGGLQKEQGRKRSLATSATYRRVPIEQRSRWSKTARNEAFSGQVAALYWEHVRSIFSRHAKAPSPSSL